MQGLGTETTMQIDHNWTGLGLYRTTHFTAGVRRYRATFALLDLDGSASLDADEIKQAFVEIGVVERTFELADWLQELKEKVSCAVLGPI